MVTGLNRDGKMSLNTTMYDNLAFKKKNARVDWRKIAGVDLERVARELDVYTLQDNIEHITFCNIESEIDTRMMDPNYIKLFKISQYTIEYLVHSQNYLTDLISSIETQLSNTISQNEELKKTNEKLNKDFVEVKKENKKRKKMIETQQTLMTVSSTNYHQCAYCSKVFLNVSYLQAHMDRRHSEMNQNLNFKLNNEIEKELERIKERLRITESELMMERNARLSLNLPKQDSSQSDALLKQIENLKSNEIKQQKEEFRKIKETLKKEISDLTDKNSKFEIEIKHLQEKLSKQSHIGWIKDDIDLEKDNALKLKQELEQAKQLISNYEKEIKNIEELKSKFKQKEYNLKQKHSKEIKQKDDEISRLNTKLAELQNSIGKSDNELTIRIQQLQEELELEQSLRLKLESELKNRPPTITPRAPPSQLPQPRQPSPPKISAEPVHSKTHQQHHQHHHDIYLTDYCPLTQKELDTNPKHLEKYKKFALELFEKEMDEFGIDLKEKGLSNADYKQKMIAVKNFRSERADDMVKFNEMRKVFADLSSKFATQKLNSSLRSSSVNRVHFKNEVEEDMSNNRHHHHHHHHHHHNHNNENNQYNDQSEETDDDVSLSNALESNDDDTEPTKSILNDSSVKSRNRDSASPQKGSKISGNLNPDEISDLESISQLLTDRSINRKKNSKSNSNSNVNELKRKLEKQFENSTKKGYKPAPNAVPIGFQMSKSKANQDQDENSFESISDLDNETKIPRPRNGVRSSYPDSNSSSVWVSDSNDLNQNLNNNQNLHDRPATANSSKTLNFDSDEIENIENNY